MQQNPCSFIDDFTDEPPVGLSVDQIYMYLKVV